MPGIPLQVWSGARLAARPGKARGPAAGQPAYRWGWCRPCIARRALDQKARGRQERSAPCRATFSVHVAWRTIRCNRGQALAEAPPRLGTTVPDRQPVRLVAAIIPVEQVSVQGVDCALGEGEPASLELLPVVRMVAGPFVEAASTEPTTTRPLSSRLAVMSTSTLTSPPKRLLIENVYRRFETLFRTVVRSMGKSSSRLERATTCRP